MAGALDGLRVLEFEALGPMPFCGMLLADMGADVVNIARPARANRLSGSTLRGRGVMWLDLNQPAEKDVALQLVSRADVVPEGNRPGVWSDSASGPCPVLRPTRALFTAA
jgi:alpha-methylacyl-CoA racemase